MKVEACGRRSRCPDAEQTAENEPLRGSVPVEAFEGLLLLEARTGNPERQDLLIAPVELVLEREFEEIELTQLRLLRVRHPIRERRVKALEFEAPGHERP